jgi:peptidoglycan hydrolase-like protein with peptidoglycan-binding domain
MRQNTRAAQAALNSELDFNLQEDGILGVQTRSAIQRFQQREGLTETGILDTPTMDALGISGRSPASVPEDRENRDRY